jgi:hypothetical protein
MHIKVPLNAFIVVFVRALDKQTPLTILVNLDQKTSVRTQKNLQPTLHYYSLGQFLVISLNLRRAQDFVLKLEIALVLLANHVRKYGIWNVHSIHMTLHAKHYTCFYSCSQNT